MNLDEVKAAFLQAGIAKLLKDIDFITQQSIRLSASRTDESGLKVGTSKLGGAPDMLSGTTWPTRNNIPQSFIAQVNLAEAHQYDQARVLPQGGMLWFFYDAQQETYGADPSDRGGWSVFYRQLDEANLARLQRTTPPATLPPGSLFKACSVKFWDEITLSHQPQLDIPNFDWNDEEVKKYENLLSTFPDAADRGTFHHRLLGFPDTIQDDMRIECQLAFNGISDADDPRAAELSKGQLDWQLLFQVDSDDQAGMRWGDAGMLYYWIRKADLKKENFSNAWLVLQSD